MMYHKMIIMLACLAMVASIAEAADHPTGHDHPARHDHPVGHDHPARQGHPEGHDYPARQDHSEGHDHPARQGHPEGHDHPARQGHPVGGAVPVGSGPPGPNIQGIDFGYLNPALPDFFDGNEQSEEGRAVVVPSRVIPIEPEGIAMVVPSRPIPVVPALPAAGGAVLLGGGGFGRDIGDILRGIDFGNVNPALRDALNGVGSEQPAEGRAVVVPSRVIPIEPEGSAIVVPSRPIPVGGPIPIGGPIPVGGALPAGGAVVQGIGGFGRDIGDILRGIDFGNVNPALRDALNGVGSEQPAEGRAVVVPSRVIPIVPEGRAIVV